MTSTILIGLVIPLLGTMLGASFVFFMKRDMLERLQKALLGFASGVVAGGRRVRQQLVESRKSKAGSAVSRLRKLIFNF